MAGCFTRQAQICSTHSLCARWGDLPVQLQEDVADITHDRNRDPHVLADLGGIDVDVDDLGVRGELLGLAGYPIVEAHADGDHQVALVDSVVGVGHPVEPQQPEGQFVGLGEAAYAQQRGDDRIARDLRQLEKLILRPGDEHSLTGDDHRLLRFLDEGRRLPDLGHVPLDGRVVAGDIHALDGAEAGLGHQDVLGDIHEDRARPPGAGDVEGLLHHPRQVLHPIIR